MRKLAVSVGEAAAILICSLAGAQQQPRLQEEVIVRWWLVPVYAVDKAGAPVLNLAPEDFEVYIKGLKVDPFTLHKKEFKVGEAKEGGLPAPQPDASQPSPPPQKKLVFLVFDTAATPTMLLTRAKLIGDTILAQAVEPAEYVLLSIEPLAGLHHVCGPTRDVELIRRNLKKLITGKKLSSWHSSAVDGTSIRDIYPGRSGVALGIGGDVASRADHVSRHQETLAFRYSLLTLTIILGYFPEYSKVVYLYSCGTPWTPTPWGFSDPDELPALGKSLSKTGTLLFVVNPAGSRLFENGGETTLRTLVSASGGRYYEGEEKEIVQEVNRMEGGYYEISFPDKPEYEGQEVSLEVRSRRPGISVYSVTAVGREKSFRDMTELEKEVLALNVLNRGPFALTKEKVIPVEVKTSRDGRELVCRLILPADMGRSEYTVFKVARNFETGDIRMDKETLVPESPLLEFRVKWRGEGYRHDVVLVHTKTGIIIVSK